MKLLSIVIFISLLGAFQVALWSADGVPGMFELQKELELLEKENAELAQRNQVLMAEVMDLKERYEALEERARSELGMIKVGETFYFVQEGEGSAL